jgi:hypothetical protein
MTILFSTLKVRLQIYNLIQWSGRSRKLNKTALNSALELVKL